MTGSAIRCGTVVRLYVVNNTTRGWDMLAKCSKLIHNGQEESRRHQDHEVSTTGKEISTTYAMKFTKMSMTSDTNENAGIASATAKNPWNSAKYCPQVFSDAGPVGVWLLLGRPGWFVVACGFWCFRLCRLSVLADSGCGCRQ